MAVNLPAASRRHRSYTVVEPRSEWLQAEECDTLAVAVPGFKKEELRVLINTRGKLKICGERHVGGDRWERFVKESPIPRSCDMGAIRAKLDKDDAVLYVILPKSSSSKIIPLDRSSTSQKPQTEQSKTGGLGSSGSSQGSQEDDLGSRKDAKRDEDEEKNGGSQDGEAPKREGSTKQGVDNSVWPKKIRPWLVLGLVLILVALGLGAYVVYTNI